MRILLIDVDSKMPNLALMKLSALHKKQGDQVFFRQPCDPDLVYIACVFSWNVPNALGIAQMFFYTKKVVVGGIGFDTKLPDEAEHIMPDYSLYGTDFSMGYTSRGCIRNCPWCVVPKKEGCIRDNAPISEFWNRRHKKIVLLDNNFLASPKWKENLEFIIVNRLEVSICQGLDIRLINDENTKWLALLRSKTPSFGSRIFHFAFDDIHYEKAVRRGIETLKAHGFNPYDLRFYVLCGFHHQEFHKDDYERYKILRGLGAQAYIMLYRDPNKTKFTFDPLLKHFQRWVNRPGIYKTCKFSEYQYLSKKEKEQVEAMNLD